MSDRAQQVTRVLSSIKRGELSPAQGVKALRAPLPEKRCGRTWLPLWLRVAVVSQGRGVRLLIPLFIVGPLGLALFIALLPLAVIATALVSIKKREVLSYFIRGLSLLCSLTALLLVRGRGTGVYVRDQDSEVGFWLS